MFFCKDACCRCDYSSACYVITVQSACKPHDYMHVSTKCNFQIVRDRNWTVAATWCLGSDHINAMAEITTQLGLNVTDQKTNVTSTDDVMASTWLRVLFVSMYCVVFVLGVSGNSLVVYVICRDKSLQTTTNVFIANLAVSDVIMCLLAVPFTPISGLLSDWVFGKVVTRCDAQSTIMSFLYAKCPFYRERTNRK